MKLSFIVLLAACVSAPLLPAQAVPAAGHGSDAQPTTWDVQGGASYLGTSSNGPQHNFYGWNASVSEFPYRSRPWLGGTVAFAGDYRMNTNTEVSNGTSYRVTVHQNIYSYLGGPSVRLPRSRVQPFAHALFGAMNVQTRGYLNSVRLQVLRRRPGGTSVQGGMFLGGGLDFPISASLALRGGADWVQEWTPTQPVNFVHASAGVVYRF